MVTTVRNNVTYLCVAVSWLGSGEVRRARISGRRAAVDEPRQEPPLPLFNNRRSMWSLQRAAANPPRRVSKRCRHRQFPSGSSRRPYECVYLSTRLDWECKIFVRGRAPSPPRARLRLRLRPFLLPYDYEATLGK
jgi:hypothetical protein